MFYCRTTSASTAPRTPRRTCCPRAHVLPSSRRSFSLRRDGAPPGACGAAWPCLHLPRRDRVLLSSYTSIWVGVPLGRCPLNIFCSRGIALEPGGSRLKGSQDFHLNPRPYSVLGIMGQGRSRAGRPTSPNPYRYRDDFIDKGFKVLML